MNLCNCTANHTITELGHWDGAPLQDGGHTAFALHQCDSCGGLSGFPDTNFRLFLKRGVPEKVEWLKKEYDLHVDVAK